MQNSTNTQTATETNFWMRQAAKLEQLEIEADAQFLLEARAVTKPDRDYVWAAFLIIYWFAWIAVSAWKTLPGGIAAVPMFLILLAIGTTVSITAWVKTR